ncbi:MAG: hypothetical protein EKK64_04940 [Neisseriaceae bacterium]|nr:MAG: hypothetical protein EKK64_04940 [Neisseriaceae bacterium]
MYYMTRLKTIEHWKLNQEYHRKNDSHAYRDMWGKVWYVNGKRHRRNDLPAVVKNDGSQEWYYTGKRHRENGPAVIIPKNGIIEYWYDGTQIYYDEEEKTYYLDFKKQVLHSFGNKPTRIHPNGTKEWYYMGVLHRGDGPAVIYPNGDCEWWRYGKRHKKTGPAVSYGNKQYWFNYGEFVKSN